MAYQGQSNVLYRSGSEKDKQNLSRYQAADLPYAIVKIWSSIPVRKAVFLKNAGVTIAGAKKNFNDDHGNFFIQQIDDGDIKINVSFAVKRCG